MDENPIAAGNVVASLMVTKVFSTPLKRLFSMFNKDYNAPRKVVGRIGRVITTRVSDKLGQVEIKSKGAPITLNVITEHGEVLLKGDEAIVVKKCEAKGVHIVAPVNLEK